MNKYCYKSYWSLYVIVLYTLCTQVS